MKKFLILLMLTVSLAASAQLSYVSDRAVATNPFTGGMVPLSYAQVRICSVAPGLPVPCTLAQAYDVNGNALSMSLGSGWGQITTDVLGRYQFACTPGNYNIQIQASGNNTPSINQVVTCPGNSTLLASNNVWTGNNTIGGVLNAKNIESVRYADQFASINAAVADLAGGCGVVAMPAGTYTVSSYLTISNGCVSIIGVGSGSVTVQCADAGHDCIRYYDSNFLADVGSGNKFGARIQGFTLIGASAGTNSTSLLHIGDVINTAVHDVQFLGNGKSDSCLWLDNTVGWTERNDFSNVSMGGCTKEIRFTATAGTAPQCGGAPCDSFGYNHFHDAQLYVTTGQEGFAVENGTRWYGGSFTGGVNTNLTATKTIFHVYSGGKVQGVMLALHSEDNGTGGTVVRNIEVGGTFQVAGNWAHDGQDATLVTATDSGTVELLDNMPKLDLTLEEPFAATAGTNFGSKKLNLKAATWNGSASTWTSGFLQYYPASTAVNPFMVFQIKAPDLGSGSSVDLIATSVRMVAPAAPFRTSTFLWTGNSSDHNYTLPDRTGIIAVPEVKRVSGCATTASAGAVCTTTVTWTTAFGDANYTAVCNGDLITSGVPLNGGFTAKDAASVTFQTVAATAAAAQYTAVDCIAIHD